MILYHLFKELAKVFFLFLFTFYFLYVLFDYSAHMNNLHGGSLSSLITYYLWTFTKKLDFLLPLALLLSSMKVLIYLQMRGELVGALSCGISMKRLSRPFLLFASLVFLLLVCNHLFIQPLSFYPLNKMEQAYFKRKESKASFPIGHLPLSQQRHLLYRLYDPHESSFYEAFVVYSLDEIYRCKKIKIENNRALGEGVEKLARERGLLTKKRSYESFLFPDVKLTKEEAKEKSIPPLFASPIALLSKFSAKALVTQATDREAEALSFFTYKLFSPLCGFLAVLAPLLYGVSFKRGKTYFLSFALFLGGFFGFIALMQAALTLSIAQMLPPFLSLSLLFLLPCLFFGWKYAKL